FLLGMGQSMPRSLMIRPCTLVRVVRLGSDCNSVDKHGWHGPLGLDSQTAYAFPNGERVPSPGRESLHSLIVSCQCTRNLVGDAIQINKTHTYFVAEVTSQSRNLLRVFSLQFIAPN